MTGSAGLRSAGAQESDAERRPFTASCVVVERLGVWGSAASDRRTAGRAGGSSVHRGPRPRGNWRVLAFQDPRGSLGSER